MLPIPGLGRLQPVEYISHRTSSPRYQDLVIWDCSSHRCCWSVQRIWVTYNRYDIYINSDTRLLRGPSSGSTLGVEASETKFSSSIQVDRQSEVVRRSAKLLKRNLLLPWTHKKNRFQAFDEAGDKDHEVRLVGDSTKVSWRNFVPGSFPL